MNGNIIPLNPAGGFSVQNGGQRISINVNGMSIISEFTFGQDPIQRNLPQNDSQLSLSQPATLSFDGTINSNPTPGSFVHVSAPQQMIIGNNIRMDTTPASMPNFIPQETITTGFPPGLPTSFAFPMPVEEVNREQNPVYEFIPMENAPTMRRFVISVGEMEESQPEQGLTRDQIAELPFSKYHSKQMRAPPRIKTRNGIFKKTNEENKDVKSTSQRSFNKRQSKVHSRKQKGKSHLSPPEKGESNIEGPSSDDICAICIENYKDGDEIRNLPCEHKFHKDCVDHWLVVKNSCPVCKRKPLEDTQPLNQEGRDQLEMQNQLMAVPLSFTDFATGVQIQPIVQRTMTIYLTPPPLSAENPIINLPRRRNEGERRRGRSTSRSYNRKSS
mgnify:FL=1